jgi:biotin carboxyl carrier protein
VLASAVRSREEAAPISRPVAAFIVLVWLKLAGEAAFGDQRPVFDRQWRGAAAFLLALAGAVHLWRRYRRPAPAPAAAATPSKPHSGLAVLVTMPKLGEDVIEGTVTRWLKQAGDRVEAGEPLVEVSTDKVDTEMPADVSGELREIRVPAGRTAPVGTTIAVIEPLAGHRPS